MTENERITELEEEVLHLCSCIEIYGEGLESMPHLVARARKLAGSPSDGKWQKSWEDSPIKICCDICDAEGLNACRGSKGDDDEPAEEEETN